METLEVTEQLSAYELERGKPMPSKNHGLVQGNMTIALGIKYRKEYSFLTELTLEFGEKNYVPDICIYPKQTYDGRNDEIRVTAPPLTAIEILSPKQGSEEIMKKFDAYFAHGVQSCWFVQPYTDTVFIFTPDKKIRVFHEETLTDPATGVSVDLNEIFQ